MKEKQEIQKPESIKTVLLVFGTRPEAIKMCPLARELQSRKGIRTLVCVTGQHKSMLGQVLEVFQVTPDFDLSIMKEGQDLFDITAAVLSGMKKVLREACPSLVLVHGDTSTAFAAALAAFYLGIPVGHVRQACALTRYTARFRKNSTGRQSVRWQACILPRQSLLQKI